jgi:hypothetical protein
MSPAEMVVLVAWNGETCNLKWLWRLTQAPNSRYSLPDNIKYFIDPYRVIEKSWDAIGDLLLDVLQKATHF